MEVCDIRFCNMNAFNIKNTKEKSELLKTLFEKYKIDLNENNLIFNEKLFNNNLKKFNYIITTITGGDKYWLYLTRIKNENYTILINKKIIKGYLYPKIIIINYRFSDILYKDTLFDTELIRDGSKWQLLIGDIIIFKGSKCKLKFQNRIQLINNILTNYYKEDCNLISCLIGIKKIFSYDSKELFKFISKCNYKIIGIRFNNLSNFKNIDYFFNRKYINKDKMLITFQEEEDNLLKIQKKEAELLEEINTEKKIETKQKVAVTQSIHLNTFLIKKTRFPNIFILFTKNESEIIRDSIARIDTIECAQMINDSLKTKDEEFVDCIYDNNFKKWVPVKISDRQKTGVIYDSDSEFDI